MINYKSSAETFKEKPQGVSSMTLRKGEKKSLLPSKFKQNRILLPSIVAIAVISVLLLTPNITGFITGAPREAVEKNISIEVWANTSIELTAGKGFVSAAALLDNGTPLADSIIEFYLNSSSLGRNKTDSNGYAQLRVDPGPYSVRAVFGGGEYLNPAEATKDVTVEAVKTSNQTINQSYGTSLANWDSCESCDIGSKSLSKAKKPVKISSGSGKEDSLTFTLNTTDSIYTLFDIDSKEQHRVRFFYKANITKDLGQEGPYISFSYGETGGICEFGFVVSNTGITLSRTPSGEVDYWNFNVTYGEWNEAVLETGPCQELQSKGLFLISVTSTPDNWGNIVIDDVSVD